MLACWKLEGGSFSQILKTRQKSSLQYKLLIDLFPYTDCSWQTILTLPHFPLYLEGSSMLHRLSSIHASRTLPYISDRSSKGASGQDFSRRPRTVGNPPLLSTLLNSPCHSGIIQQSSKLNQSFNKFDLLLTLLSLYIYLRKVHLCASSMPKCM